MPPFASGLAGRPSVMFLGSFAGLIAVGTVLFSLPLATPRGGVPFPASLFMATSAVCVTGLSVLDVGREMTPFGQWTLLALIQTGALGLMTFYAFAFVVIGQSVPLAHRTITRETLGHLGKRNLTPVHMLRSVVIFTAIGEGLGALALYPLFRRTQPPLEALRNAVFHAVSAFCNAGFSLFTDSFARWRSDPAMNLVLMALIVAGGVGFIALLDLWTFAWGNWLDRVLARLVRRREYRRHTQERLSLHTKAVLVTTGALILAGAVLLWAEFLRAGSASGAGDSFLEAAFLSVTSRTAGFNTVPTDGLGDAVLLVVMALMFVGASPGSTGGGVKTTTLFVVLAAMWARFRGYETPSVFGRSVPDDIIRRAGAIMLLGAAVLGAAVFALMAVEEGNALIAHLPRRFLTLLFESVSAFGTVGLSMGVTDKLSSAGLLILTALMYVGRIGPLTLFVALSDATRRRPRHPDEMVMVG